MNVLKQIEKFLPEVEKPARYTGGELNMIEKDPFAVDIRFAFCFPDVYEVGMSFLGLSILYHLLNAREDTYVERVFSPWPDMEDAMKAHGVPLFSLETHSTLDEFDVVGFNVSYEMCFSNIVRDLRLANIAPLARMRSQDDPLVIAGGSAIINPEPIADFMDAVFIGESEETLNAFIDLLTKKKQAGWTKQEFLEKACEIESIYVPAFYTPTHTESGYFLQPNHPNARPTISKAIVRDLDSAYFPKEPIVPYLGIVHDRITLEIFRGCTRGCRFCQAGFTYRPVREKKADTLTRQAVDIEGATGYDEISLCSLSTSDYSEITPLIGGLLDNLSDKRVNISLPSLRLDTVFKDYAKRLDSIRKSGLTFAPEAGTQRLRDIINKNITEEDLFSTMEQVFSQGYSSVKLYFMIGLPYETLADLDGIVDLVKGVKSIYGVAGKNNKRSLTLTVSASNFVPKPFTPFQWVAQDSIETLKEKQNYLKEKLKIKGVRFNYHDANLSHLEAAFARGDRRLSKVILDVVENGARFDAWNEYFDFGRYERAFEASGLSSGFYANRALNVNAPLYWDHIDVHIRKSYLTNELAKAEAGTLTPDCRDGCLACGYEGVCNSL